MRMILCILFVLFLLNADVDINLPGYAIKRMNKTINALWPGVVVTKSVLNIAEEEKRTLSFKLKGNELFELHGNGKLLGYLWLSQSYGKFDDFDYMVIFNPDLFIKRSSVLVYREDYGGEIGAKRWLAQFENKSNGKGMEYAKDIQAISGATISTRSICYGIKQLSLHMQELKHKGMLN